MLKPAALRQHLEATSDWLRTNPEKLIVNIEAGHLRLTGAASRSFEYRYTLVLTLLDFPGHPSALFVPLIQWLEANQPELILNPTLQEAGLRFDADLLGNNTADLAIHLQLTERVKVTLNPDGTHLAEHLPEPLDPYAEWTWTVAYAKPEINPAWPNV
jgi:hypothetical protein